MVDGTVINAGSGTIALLADENITLGQVDNNEHGRDGGDVDEYGRRDC